MSTNTNVAKCESTINEEEVKKFSEQTEYWWSLNGPFKGLHAMNAVRIPLIRDSLVSCSDEESNPTPLKGKTILDVGCGGGILSEALANIGADVTGIDPSKNLIEIAQHHSRNNTNIIKKPKFVCTTIEDHLDDHKDYYDAVVASEVIEHIGNKELFVKSCVSALKPGGRIFFTTPNRTRFTQIFGIYVAEYILNALPKGTHHYNMLIRPNELSVLLEKNNCQIEEIRGCFYNVLKNKWYFHKSKKLLYTLKAQKIL